MSTALNANKRLNRKPSLESLENRSMMAGNVSVYMSSGDLYIVGDQASNHVAVRGNSNGTVTVYGEFTGGDHTRINGRIGGSYTVRINDDVGVFLRGGHDQIDFGTGNGVTARVADELFIDAGDGNDWVKLRQVQTGMDLVVRTGAGRDETFVGGGSYIGDDLSITDSAPIRAGDFDKVTVSGSTVRDIAYVELSGGNDRVDFTTSRADDLYVKLGAGNDTFLMSQSILQSTYYFDGGSGYDTLHAPKNGKTVFRGVNFERIFTL